MSMPATNICYGKRPANTPSNNLKGCCCKRSQCIKNYCDCYQSMIICSETCKCIGCRNTEERTILNTTPVKTANKAKRDRAAALTAKAAAAAAKAGIDIHAKSSMAHNAVMSAAGQSYMTYNMPMPYGFMAQHQAAMNMMPVSSMTALQIQQMTQMTQMPQMMQLSQSLPQFQPFASMPVGLMPANVSGPTVPILLAPKQVKSKQAPLPPEESKNINVFTQPINAALLECMVIQAAEAENVGLDNMQIGQLVLHEALRGFTCMFNALATE